MKFSDLKVGDELPLNAVIDEMWLPVFGDGPPRWLCLKDVPVAALCAEPDSARVRE
jgi:hypothetical protein